MEKIRGTIDRFLFNEPSTGFVIFVMQTFKHKEVIAKGTLPMVQPGHEVELSGNWVFHPKFGKQFEATTCAASLPASVVGLKKYLGSGLIKGIGKVYAKKIVDHFGVDVLKVIDNEPDRLAQVEGIGPRRLEQIKQAWVEQREVAEIMVFLQDKDISPAYATKIYKKYGQESRAKLQENPYRLVDEIWGIGFKTADKLAQQLGFEKHSTKRLQAGIGYVISKAIEAGHLYVDVSSLKESTVEVLELEMAADDARIKQALQELYYAEKIKLVSHDDKHFVTLNTYYYTEFGVAQRIKKLIEFPSPFTFDIDSIYQKLRSNSLSGAIELNEDQQRGIMTCLQNKMTVITGGPGTGKTTLIKTLLKVLDEQQCQYRLAAPTGRAAKRITESTSRHALTIHRLLEFDFNTMGFTYNENKALKLDFLIVDEASMIDIFLGLALIKALPWKAHLILIGDIDQLPSVGAGNFLRDIIGSGAVPCIKLNMIFRQAHNSLITINAHRINNGEFPVRFEEHAKRDYIYIKEDEPEKVPVHLETIFKKVLPKIRMRMQDAMVLVPMNRGSVGTHMLNHQLQQMLNPSDQGPQILYGGTTYKIGDRVMQIRNNYDKHVFNGDMGMITAIDLEEGKMFIDCEGHVVEYEREELHELVLAYAVTVHKSQGSEYPVVIVPLFTQHFMLLQRNLIYTAITRAKKLCIFIGQAKAIAMGVKNNKTHARKTFLKEYLTTDLVCR